MIGKDFLAKLLSRWIYPGLVLVDSGTFSLLSQFLFMTCHLLQQARSEPLARSSCSGCGSERSSFAAWTTAPPQESAGPWQDSPALLAPGTWGLPGAAGWEGLRQRSWQLLARGCCGYSEIGVSTAEGAIPSSRAPDGRLWHRTGVKPHPSMGRG